MYAQLLLNLQKLFSEKYLHFFGCLLMQLWSLQGTSTQMSPICFFWHLSPYLQKPLWLCLQTDWVPSLYFGSPILVLIYLNYDNLLSYNSVSILHCIALTLTAPDVRLVIANNSSSLIESSQIFWHFLVFALFNLLAINNFFGDSRILQGIVDGSASKPALRQDTGYMVEKTYLDIAPYLVAFGAYLMPQ